MGIVEKWDCRDKWVLSREAGVVIVQDSLDSSCIYIRRILHNNTLYVHHLVQLVYN